MAFHLQRTAAGRLTKSGTTVIGVSGAVTLVAMALAYGGYRRNKHCGRLDGPSAPWAFVADGYAAQRVFFADDQAAIDAGCRPCAMCLPEQYRQWKAQQDVDPASHSASH